MGTQVIKEYKKSMKFQGEVGEVAYDAFQKGFAECKENITEAFLNLD